MKEIRDMLHLKHAMTLHRGLVAGQNLAGKHLHSEFQNRQHREKAKIRSGEVPILGAGTSDTKFEIPFSMISIFCTCFS